mmetsp:Transcript_25886/g.71094  ORF Transcript_25886/g.71094 Transcript_25886/m.71094 type:complete len:586 (+) Transcript_25886:142-1899(+)|eukprot:CAMPEP_0172357740 /NCGR_PEP_ID=MMETSP1060-20121228/2079_1 /TAXON_ID=37318 /ORGANISM="Pseudo-nitzschia pungens, Strain cf. cingulata" /LENGTH=585 /DNA_ID=CAMNT_0013078551 /DNA_START=160 /DNA_END=1917 /DNA_ORIENTATION=-
MSSSVLAVNSVFSETSLSSTNEADCDNDGGVEPAANDQKEQDKLILWQGIVLLTAECVGVGILGLPNEVKLLGWAVGVSFLVLNCPINYYAGNLLSKLALRLESEHETSKHINSVEVEVELARTTTAAAGENETPIVRRRNRKKLYEGLPLQQQEDAIEINENLSYEEEEDVVIIGNSSHDDSENDGDACDFPEGAFQDETVPNDGEDNVAPSHGGDIGIHATKNGEQTSDLINLTAAVFSPNDTLTSRTYIMLSKILYYVNLFLVLGDYILVMSRSVAAFIGEDNICMPTAGVIASTLMFGLCQFRTMAKLGRSVSVASLLAILIVLVQCLFHHRLASTDSNIVDSPETRIMLEGGDDNNGIWGKCSSLAGVAFAVGSQKLFLNIRHELRHREEASKVLAGSLFTYGSAYVLVVLLAGPDPPSFLFDAIPEGWGRRIAGLLLWFHVAVSYAINSQALCASLDHMVLAAANTRAMSTSTNSWWSGRNHPAIRWFGITLVVSLSSYMVSNAIPFFKDLVALIGALTSVPLFDTSRDLAPESEKHCPLVTRWILYFYGILRSSLVLLRVLVHWSHWSLVRNRRRLVE